HYYSALPTYTCTVLVRDRRFDRIVSATNREMPANRKYHQIACLRSASAGVGAVAAAGWAASGVARPVAAATSSLGSIDERPASARDRSRSPPPWRSRR